MTQRANCEGDTLVLIEIHVNEDVLLILSRRAGGGLGVSASVLRRGGK